MARKQVGKQAVASPGLAVQGKTDDLTNNPPKNEADTQTQANQNKQDANGVGPGHLPANELAGDGFQVVQRKSLKKSKETFEGAAAKNGASNDQEDHDRKYESPINLSTYRRKLKNLSNSMDRQWLSIEKKIAANMDSMVAQELADFLAGLDKVMASERTAAPHMVRRWRIDQIEEEQKRVRKLIQQANKKKTDDQGNELDAEYLAGYLSFVEQEKRAAECAQALKQFLDQLNVLKSTCMTFVGKEKREVKDSAIPKDTAIHQRLESLQRERVNRRQRSESKREDNEELERNTKTIHSAEYKPPMSTIGLINNYKTLRAAVERKHGVVVYRQRKDGTEYLSLHSYDKDAIDNCMDFLNRIEVHKSQVVKDREPRNEGGAAGHQHMRRLANDQRLIVIQQGPELHLLGTPEQIELYIAALQNASTSSEGRTRVEHDAQQLPSKIIAIDEAKYNCLAQATSLWRKLLVEADKLVSHVQYKMIGDNKVQISSPNEQNLETAKAAIQKTVESWIIDKVDVSEGKDKLLEQSGVLRNIRNTIAAIREGDHLVLCGPPVAVQEAKTILTDALTRARPPRHPDAIVVGVRPWIVAFIEPLLPKIAETSGAVVILEKDFDQRTRRSSPRVVITGAIENRNNAATEVRKLLRTENKKSETECDFPHGYDAMIQFMAQRFGPLHDWERQCDSTVERLGTGEDIRVVIRGPARGVEMLLKQLQNSVSNLSSTKNISVDSKQLPRIVGRGGATIRRIEKESGAEKISILSDPPTVVIRGTPEAQESAEQKIQAILKRADGPATNRATTPGRTNPMRRPAATGRGRAPTEEIKNKNTQQTTPTPDQFPTLMEKGNPVEDRNSEKPQSEDLEEENC